MPLLNDQKMASLFAANCVELLGVDGVLPGEPMAGSTDMGDITHIMPGIHPMVGGVAGRGHARDYMIVDPDMAYIVPAKAMAMTVIDLLYDDAALGRAIKDQFKPTMTKESYLAMWESLLGEK